MRKLERDEKIKAGDIIMVDTRLSKYAIIITRVTKTLSIGVLKDSENKHEYKFPSIYGFGFGLRPKVKWNTNIYEIFRKEENE